MNVSFVIHNEMDVFFIKHGKIRYKSCHFTKQSQMPKLIMRTVVLFAYLYYLILIYFQSIMSVPVSGAKTGKRTSERMR